jgi:hypothetical protein
MLIDFFLQDMKPAHLASSSMTGVIEPDRDAYWL